MAKMKQNIIPDEIVDEIVDEILREMKPEKTETKSVRVTREPRTEVDHLRNRIAELENRMNKLVENFKIIAVETSREISERVNGILEENDQQITNLESQIEALRTAMIRLSSRLKQLEEKSGFT